MKNKHYLSNESVRKLTSDELVIELEVQRGKLYHARSLAVTEKVEDTSQFGHHKRNVARLLTEQNARRPKTETAGRAPGKPVVPNKIKPTAVKRIGRDRSKPASKTAAKPNAKAATK